MFKPTLAAALLAAAAFAQAADTDTAARYDTAREQYEIGHYHAAFSAFAALADEGHCDAVRMALQMLRYGHALYATEFQVGLERVQRWQRTAPCATLQRRVAGAR